MKIGFVGPSYTSRSSNVANEECINFFCETTETVSPKMQKYYDGTPMMATYIQPMALYGTPGLKVFCTFPESPVRAQKELNGRAFAVSGTKFYEYFTDGTVTERGTVGSDGLPASIAASNIQLLIVSDGKAFCFTLATNAFVEVTASLAAAPVKAVYSDGYFIVCFENSNKFQISDVLDGTTWPGIQVNAVSVFPENVISLEVSHRDLTVVGSQHAQVYQDTGSLEIFDVIPGALIEKGSISAFASFCLDNTVFWIGRDERGAMAAWRANGYTPQRLSTYAVETAFSSYANMTSAVSYSYEDAGHLFWVIYVPGADCSWVYDVSEGIWHKRASWDAVTATWSPHWSWNHAYAFNKHLIGDWNSGNLYEMSFDYVDDAGTAIRRLRRGPTVINEMTWIYHSELNIDIGAGLGPQPPLTDGAGNPRPPQAMLRWSDDRGQTWSSEHVAGCGLAGEYKTRIIWRRLGRSRYRDYEVSMTDPIKWAIVAGYLQAAPVGAA